MLRVRIRYSHSLALPLIRPFGPPSPRKRGEGTPCPSPSPKNPVHEPFRPQGLAAPEAFAVEPEAAALRILGAEIVARRRVGAAPPRGGDAFRAFDRRDIVQDAPPAEAQWRPVGHFGDGLDRLGTDE